MRIVELGDGRHWACEQTYRANEFFAGGLLFGQRGGGDARFKRDPLRSIRSSFKTFAKRSTGQQEERQQEPNGKANTRKLKYRKIK